MGGRCPATRPSHTDNSDHCGIPTNHRVTGAVLPMRTHMNNSQHIHTHKGGSDTRTCSVVATALMGACVVKSGGSLGMSLPSPSALTCHRCSTPSLPPLHTTGLSVWEATHHTAGQGRHTHITHGKLTDRNPEGGHRHRQVHTTSGTHSVRSHTPLTNFNERCPHTTAQCTDRGHHEPPPPRM